MTLAIEFAGLSDVGKVRCENDDRWFVDPSQGIYLLADGMGGTLSGGLASRVVVETLPQLLVERMKKFGDLSATAAADEMADSLVTLSNRLRAESRDRSGLDGMGSTVVVLLVKRRQVLLAHLGDSRAYLLHDRRLERLTKDHSIVQLLLDTGDLAPEDVDSHPSRGQLTHFVGMEGRPLPEVRLLDLSPGSKILLCSDGLTGMINS